MNKLQLIRKEIERLKDCASPIVVCDTLLNLIDSFSEEPKCIYNRTLEERKESCKYCSAACDVRIEETTTNEDLVKELDDFIKDLVIGKLINRNAGIALARHFADWQQKQDYKRFGWHDAKKEQPPMEEEVIVLTNVLNGKELSTPRRICFGHIVDKEICVDYDGWNIPGVAYWMYDPKLK